MLTAAFNLTAAEVEKFHEEGYLGPFALCAPEEMAELRSRIESEVLTRDGMNPRSRDHNRHLDSRIMYDIVAHPAIIDRLASLFGEDIICWSSNFFTKEPGGKEIPWHQDFNYWPIDPPLNLSAWLAIDPVTTENSCVQIIPGSHKRIVPQKRSPDGMAFSEMADMTGVDTSKVIEMVLKPGEFFIFNERLLHHSNKNVSNKRRMGLAVRYTKPFVKITHDIPPLFKGHCAVVVSGKDEFKINRYKEAPAGY